MIYVCVVAQNQSTTVGLLLWRVRQVFTAFPREYQLLVADDGSTDATREVLDLYQRALPLSVFRNAPRQGHAAALQGLLRECLRRTDRPKRDAALLVPADFSVAPEALPDLVRRLESGADLVIGELAASRAPWALRLVRRSAPWLLRPGLAVPGVRDPLSGCYAVRLSTLKRLLPAEGSLLRTEGWCANAELVARVAAAARQIAAVPVAPGKVATRLPWPAAAPLAWAMVKAGRQLRIPKPTASVERTA
jgi:hypothetical protein